MRDGLRAARLSRGLSQDDLLQLLKAQAPDLRLQRTAISRWELGQSSIPSRLLLLLETILETPAHVLYRDSDPLVMENAEWKVENASDIFHSPFSILH